jgi:hypothetical protein
MRLKGKSQGFSLIFTIIILSLIGTMLLVLFSLSGNVLDRINRITMQTQALHLAEAGVNQAVHKLSYDSTYTGEDNIQLNPIVGVVDVTVTETSPTTRTIVAKSYLPSKANPQVKREIREQVESDSQAPGNVFSFAIQTGAGGFTADNNVKINGSIYSNQDINISGPGASVTGNASAVNKVNLAKPSIVSGKVSEGVESKPTPVIDLASWQAKASEGLTYTGNYNVSGNITLGGPGHISIITGQLSINNNSTVTIDGPVWIQGAIDNVSLLINGSPNIVIDSNLADTKTIILANNEIVINGNADFTTDKANAWLLLLSTYTKDTDPFATAIDINSNAKFTSAIIYAYNGQILINSNSSASSARAFIGQRISISGNSEIDYSSGLATTDFSSPGSSPSGGFKRVAGSYVDITL